MNATDLITCADCLDWLATLDPGTVDLVLTDPPYNIAKAEWDKIPEYVPWLISVFKECALVTSTRGQLIFWHNDMRQLPAIMEALKAETPWRLNSFITCHKPKWRARSWKNLKDTNTLRSWFNVCEYVLVYTRADAPGLSETGLSQTYSTPEFSEKLRAYMCGELKRAGLTQSGLVRIFREWGEGGTGALIRHWFIASQFELPTQRIYEGFFQGHLRKHTGIAGLYPRPFESLRQEFESLRQEFEPLRPTHNIDPSHCNYFEWTERNDNSHPCRKPVNILRRLIRVHSRPGDLVIDPFTGSGSTGEAALTENRRFLGCERDPGYCETARAKLSAVTPSFFL